MMFDTEVTGEKESSYFESGLTLCLLLQLRDNRTKFICD